jgi:hypothetical protein
VSLCSCSHGHCPTVLGHSIQFVDQAAKLSCMIGPDKQNKLVVMEIKQDALLSKSCSHEFEEQQPTLTHPPRRPPNPQRKNPTDHRSARSLPRHESIPLWSPSSQLRVPNDRGAAHFSPEQRHGPSFRGARPPHQARRPARDRAKAEGRGGNAESGKAEARTVTVKMRVEDMPLPLQRRAVRIAAEAVAAMPKLESKRLALKKVYQHTNRVVFFFSP